ncbi:hypothetical protein NA56DRAFT_657103 [Hyaloscypha hepaticicola]|uniref:Carbohydrate esterase family 16 protein n=1 Tax=Hyaloscypha hepaticicola TaxID=2082293 RepID=A0A2J6QC72_9HELO|nr:hypothetical protein NA56DRAFT_657103 [Hyaloscypha hepaticicola]
MPAVRKRLGASIVLTLLSIISIIVLLPTSRVSTRLQKIALGPTIDTSLWSWSSSNEELEEDLGGDGTRLVIFGDSWIDDTIEDGQEGKGRSWADYLCEEINCTSRLNFAASQPVGAWPAYPPTGAMTSNAIHEAGMSKSTYTIPLEVAELSLLPDLAAQIQTYIALPPPKQPPTETIFVVSYGIWDIYDFSRLDFPIAQNGTDRSIEELFKQLDILYNHFIRNLYSPDILGTLNSADSIDDTQKLSIPTFRIILPKVFDPTLLPGWVTLRPAPPAPSSVAEQQKNAVYLTQRWNQRVENQLAKWVKEPPAPVPAPQNPNPEQDSSHEDIRNSNKPAPPQPADQTAIIQKDVFYFDLPKLLLDVIVEHQLEDEELSDASGLGTGESPFESVYIPCVREAGGDDTDGLVDLAGMLVCNEPEEYLFWDSFNLGAMMKSWIGKEVGEMVRENKTMRHQWGH